MEYSSKSDGTTYIVAFNGKLEFSDNEAVQKIINEVNIQNCTQCRIDLSGLQGIDSAGLGMLLLMNEMIDIGSNKLELKSPSGQVLKMLEISNFSSIVTISP